MVDERDRCVNQFGGPDLLMLTHVAIISIRGRNPSVGFKRDQRDYAQIYKTVDPI